MRWLLHLCCGFCFSVVAFAFVLFFVICVVAFAFVFCFFIRVMALAVVFPVNEMCVSNLLCSGYAVRSLTLFSGPND